jgi:hypothetical protein
MVTNDKIEEYLIQADVSYEQIGEGMWVIHNDLEHVENIFVIHTPPVITFRVKVLDAQSLSEDNRPQLFEQLLRINSTMVGGAYGLEDNAVVIMDSLQSENLDFNEFQGSIESILLSLRSDYEQLKQLLPSHSPTPEAEQTASP